MKTYYIRETTADGSEEWVKWPTTGQPIAFRKAAAALGMCILLTDKHSDRVYNAVPIEPEEEEIF